MTVIIDNFRLLKFYFNMSKGYVVTRILSSVVIPVYPIVNIIGVQMMINSLFIENNFVKFVIVALVFLLSFVFTTFIDSIFSRRFKAINDERCIVQLTEQLMNKYVTSDLKIIDTEDYYDKFTMVIEDFPKRVVKSVEDLRDLIGNLFILVFVTYYVVKINAFLIFVFIGVLILKVTLEPKIRKLSLNMFYDVTRDERVANYVNRTFKKPECTVELKVYSIREILLTKHNYAFTNMRETISKYSGKQTMLMFAGLAISYIGTLIVNIVLTVQAFTGKINVGQYVGLNNSIERFNSSINAISAIMGELIGNSTYIKVYEDFINVENKLECSGDIEINKIDSMSIAGMNFSYDGKKKILNDISLDINKGDIIGIVGYNGAGKTTLVNVLLRLYDFDSGEIMVDGQNIKDITTKSLRQNIIYIPQKEQIYSMTVLEFILMRRKQSDDDETKVIEILKEVGLERRILSHKDGVNATLTKEFDEDGIKVSGGEFKRLLIARILASSAQLIIIDEILDSVDPINEQKLFDTIIKNTTGKTLIFISHKLFTTSYANKIIVMQNGSIIERGTHEELIQKSGIYNKMFEVQSSKYRV